MWTFFFSVYNCEKSSLESTIGGIEQHTLSVSVKLGFRPETRFLLKPGEEKRDCFMKGAERNRLIHTLPLFALFFSFLFTCMNICRCLAREKGRNLLAAGVIFI